MPYTKMQERSDVDSQVTALALALSEQTEGMETADCGGRLNYVLTTLIIKYIKIRFGKIKYSIGLMISGALINVYSEFYDRVMRPYEDKKKEENGDVGYDNIL